jgi:hypothetical protein
MRYARKFFIIIPSGGVHCVSIQPYLKTHSIQFDIEVENIVYTIWSAAAGFPGFPVWELGENWNSQAQADSARSSRVSGGG